MSWHPRNSCPLLLFVVSGFLSIPRTLGSDSGAWKLVDPWLRPRGYLAMAYDSGRGVTVMFGGISNNDVHLNDTWEYDGQRWRFRATEGPSARGGHRIAHDGARGVTVLFGGEDSESRYGDTWEWDGVAWTLRSTTGPSPRWWPGLAYDERRGVVVLCGGFGGQRNTWEWDGHNWTLRELVGVGNVFAQGMAYDSQRGVTVLFGGNGSSSYTRDTTWEWDGQAWAQRTNAPLGRVYPEMVYDAARGHAMLFGGSRHPSSNDDEYTFAWDEQQWSGLSSSGPGERGLHAMEYNSKRGVSVLFGGDREGITWEWTGLEWVAVTDVGPAPRYNHAMAYDRARDRVVLFGGDAVDDDGELRYNGETWEWDGAVWTLESTRGPSDRAYHAMAYDSARAVTILFGGNTKRTGRRFNGETWEWDGRRWTLVADTGPAPRIEHKIVYDEDRNVAVLYGGQGVDGQNFSDLWEWDGLEWRERQVHHPQPPRNSHAMAYDRDRKRIVIFGGWGEHSERLGDTWEFDPCVGLLKLKARCKAGDGGGGSIIKVTVTTTLPEGSTVPVDNTDLSNNTTVRERIPVNARGRAKHKWPDQHGQHTLTAADCPRMTQTVACDP